MQKIYPTTEYTCYPATRFDIAEIRSSIHVRSVVYDFYQRIFLNTRYRTSPFVDLYLPPFSLLKCFFIVFRLLKKLKINILNENADYIYCIICFIYKLEIIKIFINNFVKKKNLI